MKADPELTEICRTVCVRIASQLEAGEPLTSADVVPVPELFMILTGRIVPDQLTPAMP